MTAQITEQLVYNNKTYGMATEPLEPYLNKIKKTKRPLFIFTNTGCWRGYFGTWEIKDNTLFLIGLNAQVDQGREVGIDYLFPGQTHVFAEWFSGEIRVPRGRMLEYIHAGYETIYEKDMFLKFEKGILKSRRVVDNREIA
jgi:hypothetical protein